MNIEESKIKLGRKAKWFSLLISCGVFACASGADKISKLGVDLDVFRTYKVDVLSPGTKIFDFIEEVEVLGFEETAEALLSFVTECHVLKDHIVIKNGYKGDVFVYSLNGGFEYKINRKGDGPEEYGTIWDLWIDNHAIVIFDVGRSRIVKYDIQGNFLSARKVNYFGSHIFPYNTGYVLDMSTTMIDDSLQYNLLFLDSEFEKRAIAIPYKAPKPEGFVWGTNNFSYYKDGVIYHHTFSDTVYVLKDYQPAPLFSIDFGEQWLWKDNDTYTNSQKADKLMSNKGMVKMFISNVSETHILSMTIKRNGLFLIERESGLYKRFDLKKKGGGSYVLNPMQWDGDKMIFGTNSSDLREFLNELGDGKTKLRGEMSLEDIESSENPVLMWVKFK